MLLLFAYGVILFLIITRGWTTNVPKHIRASRAVACDIFLLRVSAHHWHVSAFLCNREFQGISYYTFPITQKRGLPKSRPLEIRIY